MATPSFSEIFFAGPLQSSDDLLAKMIQLLGLENGATLTDIEEVYRVKGYTVITMKERIGDSARHIQRTEEKIVDEKFRAGISEVCEGGASGIEQLVHNSHLHVAANMTLEQQSTQLQPQYNDQYSYDPSLLEYEDDDISQLYVSAGIEMTDGLLHPEGSNYSASVQTTSSPESITTEDFPGTPGVEEECGSSNSIAAIRRNRALRKNRTLRKYQCHVCSGVYPTHWKLMDHMKSHETGADVAMFPCGFPGCFKEYKRSRDRKKHENKKHYKTTIGAALSESPASQAD